MPVLTASDANFYELIKEGVCLVDFYTTHCGPCRALMPILLEAESKLPFINLIKVNADFCPKVAEDFKIELTPTLYIGKDGELKELTVERDIDNILREIGKTLYKGNRDIAETDKPDVSERNNAEMKDDHSDGKKKPKITLNPDTALVKELQESLKAKGGYCPCRRKRTPENKCMCKEFRDRIADPDFEGFCHCMLYYKSKG